MSRGCWRRVIATSFGRQGTKRKDKEYGEARRLGHTENRIRSTSNRPFTIPPSIVFLLFIGSIFQNGPERIRQPFHGEHLHLRRPLSGKTPWGMRLAFRSGPLPCCRMKRSVMCHLSGIIGMIKYKFIPVRVQNEKYLISLYPKGYKS